MAMKVGQKFEANGKCYTLADFGGVIWGEDAKGEYMLLPVFPCEGGKERKIRLRSNTKIIAGHEPPSHMQQRFERGDARY